MEGTTGLTLSAASEYLTRQRRNVTLSVGPVSHREEQGGGETREGRAAKAKGGLLEIRIQVTPPVPGHFWVCWAAPPRPWATPRSLALHLELHNGTSDSQQWQRGNELISIIPALLIDL